MCENNENKVPIALIDYIIFVKYWGDIQANSLIQDSVLNFKKAQT